MMKKLFQYLLFILFIPSVTFAELINLDELVFYINNIKTLEAEFKQINHDGSSSKGVLYIKKPGKLRMVYGLPKASVVIANDGFVTIFDLKYNGSPQTFSIENIPFKILLSSDFKSEMDNMIVGFNNHNSKTILLVKDSKNIDQGYLEITFSNNPLVLRKWVLVNSLNEKIKVNLRNVVIGADLKNDIFDPVLEFEKIKNKR